MLTVYESSYLWYKADYHVLVIYVDNSQLLLYKMLYDLWNDPNPFSGIYTNLEWGTEEGSK